MEPVRITNQKELDIALAQGATEIDIDSPSDVIIQIKKNTDSVIFACEQSTVHVYGTVVLHACDNANVVAMGNAIVYAWADAYVTAYDNSTVYAWDRAVVRALNHANVYTWSGGTVYALGNSVIHAKKRAVVHKQSRAVLIECGKGGVVIDYTDQPIDSDHWGMWHDVRLPEDVTGLHEAVNQEWGLK